MLAVVPKPPKSSKAPKSTPEPSLIQTAFRLPPELLERLDAMVDGMNEARPWPKMTRSDLVRIILNHTLDERPVWLVGDAEPTK